MAKKSRRPDYRVIMGDAAQVREGTQRTFTRPAEPGCPIHRAVKDALLDAFTEPDGAGYASKEELLKDVQISPEVSLDMRYAAEIHWDYILRAIQEETDADIMGLTGSYFKTARGKAEADRIKELWENGDKAQAVKDVNRHLVALSNGKANSDRVKGFASVSFSNSVLVVARLSRMKRVRDNLHTGYAKTAIKAVEEGVSEAMSNLTDGRAAPSQMIENKHKW